MNHEIIHGDALEELNELDAESIESCVTDPPYGLAFMGRDWDDFEPKEYQEWCEKWAEKVKRVLKPGGHLLAFSGNRTHHRLFTGVEDAGFEVRDSITWHYGCLSEDTEVLTPDGWQTHDEISDGDDMVAFNPDTDTFNVEATNRVFRYDHDGEMVRYQSPHTDQLVTPNHRVLHRENGEWKTTYAALSYDSMELPVIHASGKIRLPSDKDLSNMLLGVGSDHFKAGGKQADVFPKVCQRNAGVETAGDIKGPRNQTAGRTRRRGNSGVYQLRRNDTQTTGQGEWKRLLFGGLLPRLESQRPGLSRSPSGDSAKRQTVGGVPTRVVGEHEGREKPRMERRRDGKEAERELQEREVGSVPRRIFGNGTVKRLCSRASVEGGKRTRQATHVDGSGTPQGPRQPQQRHKEFGTVAEQPATQVSGRGSGGVSVGTTVARTSRVDYSGTVWCVQVPSSYFVARRNGQVFITGNSGFPKAADIGKHIDRRSDEEREKKRVDASDARNPKSINGGHNVEGADRPWMEEAREKGYYEKPGDEPVTDAAKKWDGWKTGLKPATEFVVVARKPFDGATVDCVLEHGTGALNVDSARIHTDEDTSRPTGDQAETQDKYGHYDGGIEAGGHDKGRYPSNVVFDEVEAQELDEDNPHRSDTDRTIGGGGERDGEFLNALEDHSTTAYDDEGGPSRYFYTSKSPKSERTHDGNVENDHPTVKPIDLIEWLITLVTPEDGTVIDPFLGSGTTCLAADDAGVNSIGIEMQEEYAELAEKRLAYYDTGGTEPAGEW